MPLINTSKAIPLHQVYNPKVRKQRAPGITWQYLLRIGRNLAAVVAALHAKGYVIGDLNESNVLVTDRALVTLVDCDSIQVRQGAQIYRCGVGKGEYTPPELQNKSFENVTRSQFHDAFGLSVLLFLLLMEGVHPFSGVYLAEGEPPGLLDNIRQKRSPYLRSPMLGPMPIAPAFDLLPNRLQRQFNRAFGARPAWRPRAKDWQRVLENLERDLVVCSKHPSHVYSDHLRACPWCQRKDLLKIEAFSDLQTHTMQIAKSKPRLRGPLIKLFKVFPVFILLLILLSVASGIRILSRISLVTEPVLHLLLSIVILTLPGILLVLMLYYIARNWSRGYSTLKLYENLLKASLGSMAFALLSSQLLELLFGFGSILKGDWSLFPALWILGFGLLWKHLRRRLVQSQS
jgi:serine/threonine protein kinase